MDVEEPWEDPDWYDLHDTTHTAGPDREPEHYRECLIALPPVGEGDHLVDVGAGTGKLSRLIAASYPGISRVTLIEPNARKLERARERVAKALPRATVTALRSAVGESREFPIDTPATLVVVGSVFMPTLMMRGGTLTDGLAWLDRALAQCATMLAPGRPLFLLETLAPPWAAHESGDHCRRLFLPELTLALHREGFVDVECVYRFRDRVVVSGTRP